MQRTILLSACLVMLAGCGQSGPLYLPGSPSEIRAVPPEISDSNEQEDDGEEPAPKD